MKKLFLLLLLTGLFISCGDDDNNKDNKGGIPLSEWKGDWNDPTDPAYHAGHGGNYFPVKGTWKLIEKNGKAYGKYYVIELDKGYNYRWAFINQAPEDILSCSPDWSYPGANILLLNNLQIMVSYNVNSQSLIRHELYEYSITNKGDKYTLIITDRKDTYKFIEYTAEDADKDGWCEWSRK